MFDEAAYKAGTDPYHSNPIIVAEYKNFLAWKCARNGVIAENIGAVRFLNFKTIDNTLAGIEINKVLHVRNDPIAMPSIDGAVVVIIMVIVIFILFSCCW